MIHRLVTTIVVAGCLALPLHASAGKKPRVTPGPYNGLFVSGCDNIAEGLYTRDLMTLKQKGKQVDAKYDKAFYTADGCSHGAWLVTMHLPAVTWTIEDTVKIDGEAVDRITSNTAAGEITVTAGQADKVKETPTDWLLTIGTEQLPIQKKTEALIQKDLRQVRQNRLLLGDPDPLGPDGYPEALLRNHPYERKKK